MSKEPIYPISSWEGFTTYIKQSLNRVLTKKEYSLMMDAYIHRKDIEELIKELS